MAFSVPKRNTSKWCGEEEEEGEEENVHLKTHATTRGMGKNTTLKWVLKFQIDIFVYLKKKH